MKQRQPIPKYLLSPCQSTAPLGVSILSTADDSYVWHERWVTQPRRGRERMDRRAQCGTTLRVLGVLLGNRSDRYQFSAGPLSWTRTRPRFGLVLVWIKKKKIKKSHQAKTPPKPGSVPAWGKKKQQRRLTCSSVPRCKVSPGRPAQGSGHLNCSFHSVQFCPRAAVTGIQTCSTKPLALWHQPACRSNHLLFASGWHQLGTGQQERDLYI